jgi:hypothetical protein
MPKIPLYQRQVRATGQSQPRMSPQAASAPWQAAGQAGQAISQVGGVLADYQQKKQAEDTSAQIAFYSTELDGKISAAFNEGKKIADTGSPESYIQVDKFYSNVEKEWDKWINSLDVNEKARTALTRKYEISKLKSDTAFYGAGGFVEKAQINFDIASWTAQKLAAERGEGWVNPETGKWEDADSRWQAAADKLVLLDNRYTEQDMVMDRSVLKSKQNYFKFTGEMQGIQELTQSGTLTPNEAISEYSEIIKSAKKSDMDINHEAQIVTIARARINSIARTENKRVAEAQNNAYKAVLDDTFEYSDLEELQAVMPQNAVRSLTSGWLAKKAPVDEDVMNALNNMERFQNGDITYEKMVNSFGKTGESMSLILLYSSQPILDSVINKNGHLAAYDGLFGKDKVFSVNEEFRSVLDAVKRYSLTSPQDSVADNVKNWFVSYDKWKKNPGDKTFDEWYSETFREAAVKLISPSVQTEDRDAILNDIFGDE